MRKIHDGKGKFLALALKILTVLTLLMSNGSAFKSFEAAQVKERSPSVAFDLKRR